MNYKFFLNNVQIGNYSTMASLCASVLTYVDPNTVDILHFEDNSLSIKTTDRHLV